MRTTRLLFGGVFGSVHRQFMMRSLFEVNMDIDDIDEDEDEEDDLDFFGLTDFRHLNYHNRHFHNSGPIVIDDNSNSRNALPLRCLYLLSLFCKWFLNILDFCQEIWST